MPATLYVVHGSHPCETVKRGLELKGIAYKIVELPPAMHAAVMRVLFGKRTVPGIRLESGEKLTGSREILRRLDQLVPEPALLPTDGAARERVLAAEAWGEDVLQAATRRILWPTLLANAADAPSFSEGAKMPLPAPVLKAAIPVVARIELKLNATSDAARAADLQSLPDWLDRLDGWIADGTLGGEHPNAADLQIAPSLKLLMAMEDLRAIIGPRPCGQWADALFPGSPGHLPVGAIPREVLPTGV
jgi:glutathione S-transferase